MYKKFTTVYFFIIFPYEIAQALRSAHALGDKSDHTGGCTLL